MSAPLLRYSAVSKSYGGRRILSDINLEIARGSATALLGLNGVGKSTLLHLALDLVAPESGEVTLGGVPARLPGARKNLAYLPERLVPPHYLTGGELLSTLLRQHGIDYDPPAVVAECAQLDFDPAALQRRARDYSKGMTQKLGLIACLLARCGFLILDEPMSDLDPLAHRLCCARLRAAQAAGITLLFSSHALSDVAQLADHVVVLHGGRVAFDDRLAVLRARDSAQNLEQAFLQVITSSSSAIPEPLSGSYG